MYLTVAAKPARVDDLSASRDTSSGVRAASRKPPTYGIEFVDRRGADRRSAPAPAVWFGPTPASPTERNDRLAGAGIGAGVGAIGGAAIGAAAGGPVGAVLGAGVGAVLGGIVGALAEGESCGASATGVALGASNEFNDGARHGLITPILVHGTSLTDVQDSELVSASVDHHGSFSKVANVVSNTSGFMAADSIPPDRHLGANAWTFSELDTNGGDGDLSFLQMDVFKIPTCGIMTAQDMPRSGYRINRKVKKEGSSVVGIVTKTAEAVTTRSHSATAGLTAKKESKSTLRP